MDPKLIQSALDALEANDLEALKEILKGMIAGSAGGGAPPPADTEATSAPPPEPKPEDKEAMALGREILALTAAGSFGAALTRVKALVELDASRHTDAAALELSERRDLIGSLVKLGAEVPATAWSDAEARVPVKRLALEPIAELRSRVTALAAAGGKPRHATPPASGDGDSGDDAPKVRALSKAERAYIKREGITEDEFNARKNSAVRRSP